MEPSLTTFTKLPIYDTILIGRHAERTEVASLLESPETRFVTLVGESGAGKTRLALEIAGQLNAAFLNGIIFVPLASVQNIRFVIPAIAAAVGVQEIPHQSILATLIAYLQTASMLLIIDNIEQVEAAAPEIMKLVKNTQNLKVLVTSQIPLKISGEVVYQLPPLSLPPDNVRLSPGDLNNYPAIALFVNRLQAVQPDFQLNTINSIPVRRICELLDGFPLAIELIAAHSESLTPTDLLLLLRNHLKTNNRYSSIITSSRAAILGPVLDWCMSRLPDLARQIMQYQGVFLGGWITENIQAIIAPDHTNLEVEQALSLLVKKHLILKETLPGEQPRFVVLDAIRAYSESYLESIHKREDIQRKHLMHYFSIVNNIIPTAKKGQKQLSGLTYLRSEYYNIRSALEYSRNADLGVFIRLTTVMGWYWRTNSHLSESLYWIKKSLQISDIPSELYGNLLYESAMAYRRNGDNSIALNYLQKSLEIHQNHNNTDGITEVLSELGNTYVDMGKFDIGLDINKQLIDKLQDDKDEWKRTVAIGNAGFIYILLHDFDNAFNMLEQAYELAVNTGDKIIEGVSLTNIGWVAYGRQQYTRAIRYFKKALITHLAVKDFYHIPENLEGLAGAYKKLGHHKQAVIFLGLAEYFREVAEAPLVQLEIDRYYQDILEDAKIGLDLLSFNDTWNEGRNISIEEVLSSILY